MAVSKNSSDEHKHGGSSSSSGSGSGSSGFVVQSQAIQLPPPNLYDAYGTAWYWDATSDQYATAAQLAFYRAGQNAMAQSGGGRVSYSDWSGFTAVDAQGNRLYDPNANAAWAQPERHGHGHGHEHKKEDDEGTGKDKEKEKTMREDIDKRTTH